MALERPSDGGLDPRLIPWKKIERFSDGGPDPRPLPWEEIVKTPSFHERVLDQVWDTIYLPEERVRREVAVREFFIDVIPGEMMELRALMHSSTAIWASGLVGGPPNPKLKHHLEEAANLYERLGWTGCEVRIRRSIQNFARLFPATPSQP